MHFVEETDFSGYMESTEGQQRVRAASDWEQALVEQFYPTVDGRVKALLPWRKTHDEFEFRAGEVTLWVGINGHGKSAMQGQCITSLCAQGFRCAMASFEMKPEKTFYRMARQTFRTPPSEAMLRDFSRWTDGKLWFYDQQGTVKTRLILAVIRYCALELKIQHMTVDSLMKCVTREDDYNAQKDFVDEVTAIARDTGMHVHLVHHARKSGDEFSPPGKMDAKGSGSITDQVDNVLIVWRNKKKEFAIKKGEASDAPDALLICEKARNGESEPRIALWYDRDTLQYVPNLGDTPQDLTAWGTERRWRATHDT